MNILFKIILYICRWEEDVVFRYKIIYINYMGLRA